MNRIQRAIALAEAEGALPHPVVTLEDQCTHILSERLNDQAPLYEELYRPHAQRLIEVITAAERSRIRQKLLAEFKQWEAARGDGSTAGVWLENALALSAPVLRKALDRICPESEAPVETPERDRT